MPHSIWFLFHTEVTNFRFNSDICLIKFKYMNINILSKNRINHYIISKQ